LSASGLLRRAGAAGSANREPDSDAATSGLRERDVRGRRKGQQGQSDSVSNHSLHIGLVFTACGRSRRRKPRR
jgi:hypothetical protein